jgi:hypothetical protein
MLLSSRLARMERLSDDLAIYSALRIWKDKLRHVQDMSSHVLAFKRRRDHLSLLLTLHIWKRQANLISGERIVTRVMDRRLLGSSWDVWSRAAWVVSCYSVLNFLMLILDTVHVASARNSLSASTR